MVVTMRRFFVTLMLIVIALPAFAGGGSETESDLNETAPSAPAQAPADSGSQAETDPSPDADPTVTDPGTADLLFGLGVMPFQDRIPSENFVLATLDGGDKSLEDYRGKVVFLNFWATWCPPCREEMPSMQVLYDELSDEGLEILAVNILEPVDLVSAFIEENEFSYPVLLDRDGRVSLRYSVRAYPTSYIIDRAGNVIGVRQGSHDWSTLEMIDGFRKLLEL